LAHELTHVVQQLRINTSQVKKQHFEAEANHVKLDVIRPDVLPSIVSRSVYALLRTNGESQLQLQPMKPNKKQLRIIESARLAAAAVRTQVAMFRLRGVVPPGPPGMPDPAQK